MRRSTRAGPPAPPASATSSSSLSSARLDRGPRLPQSAQKSTTPHSLSSEEEMPRRSQRAHLPPAKSLAGRLEAGHAEDGEGVDEEEITRCICGQTEYPGPPDIETFAGIVDAGDLFIQCDGCTVWQHGGCVGIAEENQVPDKYYCEECDPEIHQVHLDSRGQRYSLYLPLHPRARKSSMVKHDDKAKKERESVLSRASVDPSTGKRRVTMRSKEHDDEEEQLKRAIEESKREVEGSETGGRRNGKRSRDDSEDSKQELKRQRTASESLPAAPSLERDSEDDGVTPIAGKLKRAKPDGTHTSRQSEQREKDKERDKARAEAAGRRQERAGRRRADDLDSLEEPTPRPSASNHNSPPLPSSQPSSPPAEGDRLQQKKALIKKPSMKKLGNNQYSKIRSEPTDSTLPRKRPPTGLGIGSGDDVPTAAIAITNGELPTSSVAHKHLSPPAPVSLPVEVSNGRGKFGRGKKAVAGAAAPSNGHGFRMPGEEVERTFTNMKIALENMSRWVTRQQLDLPVVSGKVITAAGPSADLDGTSTSSAELALRLQKGIASWQEQWNHLG